MKPNDMDDRDPELTDADRRAIAEIRRKLDAEFQRKLDAEFGPLEDSGRADTVNWPLQHRTTHRVGYRATVVALLVGILAGTGLSVWVRYADQRALSDARVRAHDVESSTEPTVTPPVSFSDVAALQDALGEWIAATGRGDISTQMRFYAARVPVYYTWRDVPREAVRAEKVKVFGAATRLVITTDAPAVEIAHDGLTAVTRFRKQYVIEGPAIRRRGEVLQELRWTRSEDGWLIVGERDARVLRSG